MAVKTSKANKKIAYDRKLCQLLDEYNQILVAAADNLQNIRKGLRGDSTVLPGPQYSSEAALLAKLGIRPFSYGLVILTVYDNGSVFSPEVLDLTEDDLMVKFAMHVSMVTSLSMAISYPTLAATPHMLINGYKNVLAVAIATEYSFPLDDKVKESLKDPSKFAAGLRGTAGGDGESAAQEKDASGEIPCVCERRDKELQTRSHLRSS
ncbi:hypothetical protein LguiB_020955 [Lonicera macranthoides]